MFVSIIIHTDEIVAILLCLRINSLQKDSYIAYLYNDEVHSYDEVGNMVVRTIVLASKPGSPLGLKISRGRAW